MNQIQFETSKVFGVFVKLPEDVKSVKVIKYPVSGYWLIDTDSEHFNAWKIHVSNKPIELQGFVSEITDEQKEGVVPNVDMTGYGKLFPNYLDDEGTLFMDVDQSFETLTDFLKVYIDNPYGDEPKQNEYRFLTKPHNLHMTDVWKKEYDAWQTAEQNVGQWCLLTCDK